MSAPVTRAELASLDNGGSAFPHKSGYDFKGDRVVTSSDGMTLRDYFARGAIDVSWHIAIEALKAEPSLEKYRALVANRRAEEIIAETAYKIADAMLAERAK